MFNLDEFGLETLFQNEKFKRFKLFCIFCIKFCFETLFFPTVQINWLNNKCCPLPIYEHEPCEKTPRQTLYPNLWSVDGFKLCKFKAELYNAIKMPNQNVSADSGGTGLLASCD